MSHFNADPELPVYSQTSTGYLATELIDILMSDSISDEKVCRVQPLGVNHNCTFVMDLDSVSIEDLKADDLGSWKSNGTRRMYFQVDERNKAVFVQAKPTQAAGYFVLIRRYFIHTSYSKFRRCIVEIQG